MPWLNWAFLKRFHQTINQAGGLNTPFSYTEMNQAKTYSTNEVMAIKTTTEPNKATVSFKKL